MESLIAPVVEVFTSLAITPSIRQIGYCIHHKKNMEKFKIKMEDLNNTKTDIQTRVIAAEKNLESIREVIKAWLRRVDKEINQDETTVGLVKLLNGEDAEIFNHNQCSRWCSCNNRRKVGRAAEKKIEIIDEFLNEAKSFSHDVSHHYPPDVKSNVPKGTEDIADLASRESTMNQVMIALKDEGTYSVGIYGMGGVGKTTLVNHIRKEVKKQKLFNVVIMTTVTHNPDLKRIQDEIAHKLGLLQLRQVDDTSTRAALLSERLKQEKRILVIFDDVWTEDLDILADVGIPYGKNRHKVCKVIITTRSLEVCNSLLSPKNIEVGVLTEADSWLLFKKSAGNMEDFSALQTVAEEIVKECGGLPLALVTLGRALRNKDKLVWDDTVLQLRSSNFTYVNGMNSKVFSSIRLSYDHLGNEIIKRCFLFCSLFHEDCQINIDKLMMYVMSDQAIMEDLETIKQVRGRLQTVLDKLIASCLLLLDTKKHDGTIFTVKMHDIVRDVAIKIASEEDNGFFVLADVGLKDWPEKKLLSTAKCLRLSLMENKISTLPDNPELPHLLSLSLEKNRSLQRIPDNFFQSMIALVALDLSHTGISSLPSSLSFLVNLLSLHLDCCNFYNNHTSLSVIGKLKKLEILSFMNCYILRLPEEIGGLSNLKSLNLSDNHELSIPTNVISRLSRLEELYMKGSSCQWEVGQTRNGSNASLDEIASLTCLNTLHLDARNNKKLSLSISMGCSWPSNRDYVPYYCNISLHFDCYLSTSKTFYNSIKVLLARLDNLMLVSCTGLSSVEQLVTDVGFPHMVSLFVGECHQMEYLACTEKVPVITFTALKKLYLHSLSNLKSILCGSKPSGFFDKLNLLQLQKCKELDIIFHSDVFVKLKNLRVLRVEECRKLKEVFYLEDVDGSIDKDAHVITYPRLSEMYLKELPELMTIWKGVSPAECLQTLQVLEVEACKELKCLFTPAMLLSLQKLEKLKISRCSGMVTIVESSSEHDKQDLALLDADQASSQIPPHHLENTCHRPSETLFPNLRELIVDRCHSMEHLLPIRLLLVHGGLPKLNFFCVGDCNKMEVIFYKDGYKKTGGISDGEVPLSHLRQLHLVRLPNLSNFQQLEELSDILVWPALEVLKVDRCKNLKRLPLSSHNNIPPKLKVILGDSQEWFDEELQWNEDNDQSLKTRLRPLFKVY
ncbi:hypothetical protein MKW94_029179 [Papaver nudicaule]|uniref:Disease resistance protein n=1 Tax=Papaver nudicaule TaxID=74823 RepID=A0AA41UTM9_PAPNU|nr:hypothetical protein [Papaver nudicaule]